MNPESPTPREQVEARLTALLLGELSADEAAALREVIARDPQLAALHDRMKQTIAMVRETALEPAEAKLEAPAPMRLSESKREKLLAQFKTVKSVQFVPQPQKSWVTTTRLLELAAVVAVLAVLSGLLLPARSASKRKKQPAIAFTDFGELGKDKRETDQDKKAEPHIVDGSSGTVERKLAVSPQQQATEEQLRMRLADRRAQEELVKNEPSANRGPVAARAQVPAAATPAATPSTTIVLPSQGETAQEKTTLAAADSLPPGPHLIHEYQFNDSAPASASNSVVAQGNNLVPTLQHRWTFVSTDGSVAAPVVFPTTLGVIVSTNYQTAQSSDFANGGAIVAGTPVSELQLQVQNSFYRDLNSASNVGPGQNQVALDGSVPGALNSVLRNVNKDDTGASRYFQNGDAASQPQLAPTTPPQVTTESGRQAQRQAVDEQQIIKSSGLGFGSPGPTVTGSGTVVAGAATPVFQNSFGLADSGTPQVASLNDRKNVPGNAAGAAEKGGEQLRERNANKTADQGIVLPTGITPSTTASEDTTNPRALGFNWTTGTMQPGAAPTGSSEVASTPPATDFGPGGAGGGGFGGRAGRGRGGRGGGGGANGGGISGGGGRGTIVASAGTQPSLATGAAVPTQYAKAADISPALDQLAQKDKNGKQLSDDVHAVVVRNADAQDVQSMLKEFPGAQASRAQTVQQNMNGSGTIIAGAATPPATGLGFGSTEAQANTPAIVETRNFQVDPKTFIQGLEAVVGQPFGGTGGGVGGVGGGVGGSGGGFGANLGGSRNARGNNGIQFVSGSDSSAVMSQTVRAFFNAAGVPLNSNTAVFFDDRKGTLTVRGTSQDLDLLQAAVETFSPPTNKPIIEARLAEDRPMIKAPTPPLEPQPEMLAATNAFSTFSLNVSDVSFKLAQASLARGLMPDAGSVRSEEFINAFDYRDPAPAPGAPIGFAAERAHYPFAHNRDLLRFSVKTAASGREAGRPLNLVLVLDNSGSMERADRVAIIHEAMKVLASQLQQQDTISVVTFARTARLWVDGIPGLQAGSVLDTVGSLTPEGGTDLGQALDLGYATAHRHYLMNGVNRVVLLTDGAANLGNVDANALKAIVEAQRKQGIDLDCFGIGWEGYNDDLLEVLTRNGDGRYGFINTPEEAAGGFASQLAGALRVAASDVKVQVEFNPARVISYRQIGYAKHQLTKEQFRDNTVAAAQIGAAEAGNALYTVELNPNGSGPVCTVHVRYRDPGTANYYEHAWDVPYNGDAVNLAQASPAMRLAATAAAFSEWLGENPFAVEVTPDALLKYLNGVSAIYGADTRPAQLETMIREAKSVTGK